MASEGLGICEIPEEVKKDLKAFRFRKKSNDDKNKVAVILKIVPKEKSQTKESENYYTHELKVEETIVKHDDDELIDDEFIEDTLPAQPRFILISSKCKTDDNRTLYPQILIHYNPRGVKTELVMLYTGTLQQLQDVVKMQRVTVVQDSEDMSNEWLNEQLLKFR